VSFAAPTPAQQLDAFRARVQAILSQELKIADVTWTPRRDLQFVVEEFEYRLFFDADDPLFLVVSAGLFAGCADEATRARALAAASMTNQRVKVAKVIVVPSDDRWAVGATTEVLLPAFDTVDKAFVKRIIGLLRHGVAEFRRCYEELGER
jgi:hypothetical protein